MREKTYWVCISRGHSSVMEIIPEEEREKFEQTEGDYVRLCRAQSRGAAIELAQNMLAASAAKDPSCLRLKEALLEIYG